MNVSYSPKNIIDESPYISAGIAVATLSLVLLRKRTRFILATILVIVMLLMIWFYRRPLDTIRDDNVVVSPAYGTIYEILPVMKNGIQYTHISIFLSPSDVHVQYIPLASTFVETLYDATGKFNLAYEMNKSNDNEKAVTTISDGKNNIYITQIAGFLVRRINTKPFKKGEGLKSGQELGMIKFGSRVDIELPENYNILVKEGQYVKGPETVIAKVNPV
jgi:phosphatidylserine decarboxylase